MPRPWRCFTVRGGNTPDHQQPELVSSQRFSLTGVHELPNTQNKEPQDAGSIAGVVGLLGVSLLDFCTALIALPKLIFVIAIHEDQAFFWPRFNRFHHLLGIRFP